MSPDARFWYIMGTLARPFGAGGGIWSVLFRRSKKSPPPSVRDRISSEPKFRVHDLDAAAAPPNDGGAVLTVTNDRSHAPGDTPGSGLTGLTERLAEIGGTLTADRDGDTFTLTAHIPSPELERLAEAERSQA